MTHELIDSKISSFTQN